MASKMQYNPRVIAIRAEAGIIAPPPSSKHRDQIPIVPQPLEPTPGVVPPFNNYNNHDVFVRGGFLEQTLHILQHVDPDSYNLIKEFRASDESAWDLPYWLIDEKGIQVLHPRWVLFFRRQPKYLNLVPIEVYLAYKFGEEGQALQLGPQYQVALALKDIRSTTPTIGRLVPPTNSEQEMDSPDNLLLDEENDLEAMPEQQVSSPYTNLRFQPIMSSNELLDGSHAENSKITEDTAYMLEKVDKRKAVGVADSELPVQVRHREYGQNYFAWPESRILMWLLRDKNRSKTLNELPVIATWMFWCPLRSVATSPCVDIRLVGNVPLTVEEILCFFPLHTPWRAISQRLISGQWTPSRIIRYIKWSRQLSTEDVIKRGTVSRQMDSSDKFYYGRGYGQLLSNRPDRPVTLASNPGAYDAARGLKNSERHLDDIYLKDCAAGLVHWPKGDGEGPFTRAVYHALTNDTYSLISEVEGYIAEHHLYKEVPTGPVHEMDYRGLQRQPWREIYEYTKPSRV